MTGPFHSALPLVPCLRFAEGGFPTLFLPLLFSILFGEELLEDDDGFLDRLDHARFSDEIGVVEEIGEQGDHDGADEEAFEPAHGCPGDMVDPVGIGHLEE